MAAISTSGAAYEEAADWTHTPAQPTPRPRLQQRTTRSFVTDGPPDTLAAWLMRHAFVPIGTSASPHEYGRFQLGGELLVLYWNGSVVAQGADWQRAAKRLAAICEAAPAEATLFDLLDGESEAQR